ncbi:Anaphase-promoting complex subunit [Lachnellula suecica]|uniref:Anaphase-promoting complex subunit n=1 Tax=Lachnellula suecica TaxID=602035 RepID=A0A8T9CBN9_9HELO|nr:Anaphase-promoting complex subunit [Lachnellula suecica]
MTPTPPSYAAHPTHSSIRLSRNRRPRNANPYDSSHHAASQMQEQMPVTPLVDEGADELEDDDVDISDDDEEDDEDIEHGDVEDFEGQVHDVEDEDDDEEGGIEEGSSHLSFALLPFTPGPHHNLHHGFYIYIPIHIHIPNPRRCLLYLNFALSLESPNFPQTADQQAGKGPCFPSGLRSSRKTGRHVPMEIDVPFNPAALGLKEIGNLASWTVSSCKPGCGVEALRDDDTHLFWQSDGPQPHHLNIHFSRLVSILSIRIYLDFQADESYTPTKITLLAGTGYHDLISFSELSFEKPQGWIDVPLHHVGGGEDGKTLRAFLVQVKIVENHQNGKDTHVRGLKVYARDERARGSLGILPESEGRRSKAIVVSEEGELPSTDRVWLIEPDWMGDPELR